MTVDEIVKQVMFQTNNDTDDAKEYEPYIFEYIKEGYDKMIYTYAGEHVGDTYAELESGSDEPETPGWTHIGLAYYATWCLYRNGNQPKQKRGMTYLHSFNEILSRMVTEIEDKPDTFSNIPDPQTVEYSDVYPYN